MIKSSKPFPIASFKEEYPQKNNYFFRNRNLKTDYPPHIHDYFEIEIIVSGKAHEFLNGIPICLERGVAHILSTNDVHDLTVIESLDIYKIMVHPNQTDKDIIRNLIDNLGVVKFNDDEYAEITQIAELLIKEYNENQIANQAMINSLLNCLVIMFSRKEKIVTQINQKSKNHYIKDATDYILLNYTNPLSSCDIAKHLNISPSYFSALFHKQTGDTVTDFITKLRLDKAHSMLLMGNFSVSEVCYDCGFNSLSNFLRAYKLKYGVSPNETKKSKCYQK